MRMVDRSRNLESLNKTSVSSARVLLALVEVAAAAARDAEMKMFHVVASLL